MTVSTEQKAPAHPEARPEGEPSDPQADPDAADEGAVLALDPSGHIRDCNRAAEALFHYRRSQLIRHHVSLLVPRLADTEFTRDGDLNQRLSFLCRVARFQAVRQGGDRFDARLFINDLLGGHSHRLRLVIRPLA